MNKHENPAAFPEVPGDNNAYEGRPGMDLRDWFAGQALGGILASEGPDNVGAGFYNPDWAAERSYHMADAMLAVRERTTPPEWFPMSAAVTVDGPEVVGDVDGTEVRMTFWQNYNAWREVFPSERVGDLLEPTRWRHLTEEEKARG